ncbi:hypothetical protein PPYR_06300 [Photinus pyralis]|uniref:Uncharacterized protein n=2 Tax=Photinus pyralis TaxID=7054 RepID=A0A5N4ATL3_PHOPY|nr:hypothetical protein PPYR_06300 [Photinus pyralis]
MVFERQQHSIQVDARLDALEQYSRRNNLRLFGIKECSNENPDQLAIEVIQQKLNVNIELRDIDRSHRVGLPRDGKSRAILIKFVSYRLRAEVFKKKKLLKGTHYSIKEDLTKSRLSLLQEAASRYGGHNVWSYDGRVMVNYKNKKVSIQTASDFPK